VNNCRALLVPYRGLPNNYEVYMERYFNEFVNEFTRNMEEDYYHYVIDLPYAYEPWQGWSQMPLVALRYIYDKWFLPVYYENCEFQGYYPPTFRILVAHLFISLAWDDCGTVFYDKVRDITLDINYDTEHGFYHDVVFRIEI